MKPRNRQSEIGKSEIGNLRYLARFSLHNRVSAGGKSFISCVFVTHVLYCLVPSWIPCLLYIHKHNYGAIVLGREGCRAVSGLQILFCTKVYIFSDSLLGHRDRSPNIPSDHTKQFLDITTHGGSASGQILWYLRRGRILHGQSPQ